MALQPVDSSWRTIDDLIRSIPLDDPRQAVLKSPQFQALMQQAKQRGLTGEVFEKMVSRALGIDLSKMNIGRGGELTRERSGLQTGLMAAGTLAMPFGIAALTGGLGAAGAGAGGGTPHNPPSYNAPPLGGGGPGGGINPGGVADHTLRQLSGAPDWLKALVGALPAIGSSLFNNAGSRQADSLDALVAQLAPSLSKLAQIQTQRAEASGPLYDRVLNMAEQRLPTWAR